MEQRQKLYEGKAKILYETDDPGLLIQYFKDDATAFNKNAEFYAFWRSLTAYRDVFEQGGSVMVLDPDSEFFRYFKSRKGSK